MARIDPEQALVASVLDRLLGETRGSNRWRLAELKRAVCRDLANLLNTRRRLLVFPDDVDLEGSIMDYGVPDVTGANLASSDARDDFLRSIEELIERFEPRLKNVEVRSQKNADEHDRTVRFRIRATLAADPEPVTFSSQLDPVSRSIRVKV